jgi:hypothetical protein
MMDRWRWLKDDMAKEKPKFETIPSDKIVERDGNWADGECVKEGQILETVPMWCYDINPQGSKWKKVTLKYVVSRQKKLIPVGVEEKVSAPRELRLADRYPQLNVLVNIFREAGLDEEEIDDALLDIIKMLRESGYKIEPIGIEEALENILREEVKI